MPTVLAGGARFGGWDWGVLIAYFALLVGTGYWFSRRKQRTTSDYFLAGRSMPAWAVAVSLLATAQSAATFIGVPDSAFAGDLSYLSSFVGWVLAALVIGAFFVPAYYRAGVMTPYELLEARFGPAARTAGSWTYIVGRVFASGARLFVGSLPASWIIFGDDAPGHVLVGIGVMTAAGVVYTLAGGVRSVIWTDVIQAVVYMGCAIAALVFLARAIPAGWSEVLGALAEPAPGQASKLTVVPLGVDPGAPGWGFDPARMYTLLTAVTGMCLLIVASHGADQEFTQRMLTCRSARSGARSMLLAVAIHVPTTAVFLAIGLLLWVYFRRPDLMGGPEQALTVKKGVFVEFIVTRLPPGMAGLMIAGLIAVGLSPGTFNAMASAFVGDVYRARVRGREERHYLRVGRLAVVVSGLIVGAFACVCVAWYDPEGESTLLDFVLGVMSFAYAGMLGVFFTALFTRRGSSASAIAALFAGFLTVVLLQPVVWRFAAGLVPVWAATPDDPRFTLGDLRLAFPWQLVIGTMVATAVCCLGRPKTTDHRGTEDTETG